MTQNDYLKDKKKYIPIIRKDLIIKPFGKNSYLIVNQFDGYNIKVSSIISKALKLIDGNKTADQIYKQLNSNSITIEEFYSFLVKNLSEYGIILNGETPLKRKKKYKHLSIRLTLVPISITNGISNLFKVVYKPIVIILIIAIFLFLLGYNLFYNVIFFMSTNIRNISLIDNIILVFILSIALSLFHEIGHASALKYYNGIPKEIGFGLYLIFPVFYCEVTDAWKLKKWQRIVVNFGGIYFETIIISFLLVYYMFSFNINIFILSMYTLTSLLYNLNPLIRTDGYWILSDATNTPNLTSVSAQRMRLFFKFIFSNQKIKLVKKDYFLIIYAILSKIYIVVIISLLFIYNSNSIINFVPNIFNLDLAKIQNIEIKQVVIPLIFYIVTINYTIRQIKNYRQQKHKKNKMMLLGKKRLRF